MIRYPKTPRLKNIDIKPWAKLTAVVSEKLDGANAGVSFSDAGELVLQSRGHVLRGGPREKQFDLFKSLCSSLREPLYEALGSRYILFGEWLYAKHRSFYDCLPGYFLTYDMYDKESEIFLSTSRRQALLKELPLPEAPILYQGRFSKVNNFGQFIGESRFKSHLWRDRLLNKAEVIGVRAPLTHTDGSNLMEGIYVKIEDPDKVVGRFKMPRPEFEKVRDSDLWDRGLILPNSLAEGDGIEPLPGTRTPPVFKAGS